MAQTLSEIVRNADQDAMLLAEAFALGQVNPSIWEAYLTGWQSDVLDRINKRFPAGATVPGPGVADTSTSTPAVGGDSEPQGDA